MRQSDCRQCARDQPGVGEDPYIWQRPVKAEQQSCGTKAISTIRNYCPGFVGSRETSTPSEILLQAARPAGTREGRRARPSLLTPIALLENGLAAQKEVEFEV